MFRILRIETLRTRMTRVIMTMWGEARERTKENKGREKRLWEWWS